ncbi:hypothetical protein DFQ50_12119 [Pseudocitrobacter faecalis]|uniref:Uncharacterized protein n=1 Tax=Pseudocitrobacter faecalis TaxID=1398493 RepID=A0ABX9FRS9_9ENTR|nr:hypothetical protein DFQ50_12119 [Pseudocitrobacter faecalis]
MINFIIGLSGIDPKTGQEIWLAKTEKKMKQNIVWII